MPLLHRLRFFLLLLVALAAVALWPGVQAALRVDNSLAVWFLENDPGLRAYRDFQQRFGNDEVVILVVHDPQTVAAPRYLNAFVALTHELEALPGVERVSGPGNAVLPTFGLLGAGTRPLLGEGSTGRQVRQALRPFPTLHQTLFSDDYRAARFLIQFRQTPDFDDRRGDLLAGVRRVTDRHFSPKSAYLGGIGVVYTGLNDLSQHDFGLFLGLGYLLMVALLLGLYRDWLVLAYALGIVGLGTYLTLGVYGVLGYRVNLMTVLLPLILVILGILDAMHVVNERNRLSAGGGTGREVALRALGHVFRPGLFTMLTTAAGFLALLSSPMAILRTFGAFTALGIALCFGLTFLLGVVLLPLARPRDRTARITHRTEEGLVRFSAFVLRHGRALGIFSGILVLFFALGLGHLKSDTYTLGYLPADHRVVTDHRAIEKYWGPYLPLDLLVEPRPGRVLTEPALLRATFAFADSVQCLANVGAVWGYHSLVQAGLEGRYRSANPRLRDNPDFLRESSRRLASDYPDLYARFIHAPTGTGRITVSGTMLSAGSLRAKTDTVLRLAQRTLGPLATVRPAGYQPMYANIVGYVTRSQTDSLLLSFGVVFLLTWGFIRNFRLALLTVVPNLFPVLVLLGAMGWLGIRLDTATASIASIVLSICVDDTIHFVYQYQRQRRRGDSPDEARLSTLRRVGPTVVLTSLILLLGYAVLLLGSLKTVQLFGLLTVIAFTAAAYGELVLFPLVLKRFDRAVAQANKSATEN